MEQIMTVNGPIAAAEMGTTLTHEHVLVDFVGAEAIGPGRYDPEQATAAVLPHLVRARELGCRTFIDATPAYVGRDPRLLARLASASGLQIVTNTGYYGGAGQKFLPRHALTESADELAARWLAEWRDGLDGSAVRPGLIKIRVDGAPLSPVERRLVQAAARTHLGSGLTIASHTGKAPIAFAQLAVLKEEGVHPSAFIWVHAHSEPDALKHAEAGQLGAWVSFDYLKPETLGQYVELVRQMKGRGLLGRVLLSHDGGWYDPSAAGGPMKDFRPYDTLFVRLLPALAEAGLSEAEIRRLTVENPAAAFGIRVRAA